MTTYNEFYLTSEAILQIFAEPLHRRTVNFMKSLKTLLLNQTCVANVQVSVAGFNH